MVKARWQWCLSISAGAILTMAIGFWATVSLATSATEGTQQQQPTPTATPGQSSCSVDGTKLAFPQALTLGEMTTITMTARGLCPDELLPVHIVLVLDGSGSMQGDPLKSLQDGMTEFVDGFDLPNNPNVEFGVVEFNGGTRTLCNITNDVGSIKSCIGRLRAEGGTCIDCGIRDGMDTLEYRRRRMPINQFVDEIIFVVTDGANNEGCAPVIEESNNALSLGIELYTSCIGSGCDAQCMRSTAHSVRHYLGGDPDWDHAREQIVSNLTRPSIQSLTVVDTLPSSMEYVPGSAVPEPTVSPGQDQLTWIADFLPTTGLTMTFKLRPKALGTWPTSLLTTGEFRDHLLRTGTVTFPIPQVSVLPSPTPTRAPSTTPTRTRTPTRTATLSPTVTRTTPTTPTRTPTLSARPPNPLPWPNPTLTTGIRSLLLDYYGQEARPDSPLHLLAPDFEADKAPAAKDPDTLWEALAAIADPAAADPSPACHAAATPADFVDCSGARLALARGIPYAGGLSLFRAPPGRAELSADPVFYQNSDLVDLAGQFALYHAFVREFDAPNAGGYTPGPGREARDAKRYHERMIQAYEAHMRSILVAMLADAREHPGFQLALTRSAGWLLTPYVRTAQIAEETGAWASPVEREAALALVNGLGQRIWWEWVVPQAEGPRTAGKAPLGSQATFDAALARDPNLVGGDRFHYLGRIIPSLRPAGLASENYDGLWFDADFGSPGEIHCSINHRPIFGPNWQRCMALARRQGLDGPNSPFGTYYGSSPDCAQRTYRPTGFACGETNLGSMAEEWLGTYGGARAGMRLIDRLVAARDPDAPPGAVGPAHFEEVDKRLGYGVAGFHGGEGAQDELEWTFPPVGGLAPGQATPTTVSIRTLSAARHDGETQNERHSLGETDNPPNRRAGIRGDTWLDLGRQESPGAIENHVPGPNPLYAAVLGSMVLGDKVEGGMSPSLYDNQHRNQPDEFEVWLALLQSGFYRCQGVDDPADPRCRAFEQAPGDPLRIPLFVDPRDAGVPAAMRHAWRNPAGAVDERFVADPDRMCEKSPALAFGRLPVNGATDDGYLLSEGGFGAYGLLLQAGGAFMRLASARYDEGAPGPEYVGDYQRQRDTALVPWYREMERLLGGILALYGSAELGYVPDIENAPCARDQGADRAPLTRRAAGMGPEAAIAHRARWYSAAALWYWWYDSAWFDIDPERWRQAYTWRSRFAVVGDYGYGAYNPQPVADVANLVKSWDPVFVITTGDNNYETGEADTIDANVGQFYHPFIYPYQGSYGPGATFNRFFPSLGNHDWDSPNGPQAYLDYFTLPGNERYYRFGWPEGLVDFFVLDSDPREPDGRSADSIQGNWLQAGLRQSSARWQFVIMHHSPFTSNTTRGSEVEMQWPYAAWGTDAVLAGHGHVYERVLQDGIPYFTNGLGGHPTRYTFGPPIPGGQAAYSADWGAMLVDVYTRPDRVVFKFVNRAGQVVDRYELR